MIFIILRALALLACCFQLSSYAEIPADIQKIINRGKLIVAISQKEYPPFFYHNSKNELQGFDIEIVNELASYLGIPIEYNTNANSFNDVISEVEADRADIGIGELSATIPRGLKVSFSTPYLKENKVLILNRVLDMKLESDDTSIRPNKLKFAVIKNSSYEAFLKKKFYTITKYTSDSEIVSYDNIETAMNDLMEGKIYSMFIDEIKANYLLKNLRSANIYTKKHIVENQTDPIAIAVNHKDTNLLRWINLFVDNIDYNGTKSTLIQKYFKGLK
jgi:polar amino acid transport system substrate-binding protein